MRTSKTNICIAETRDERKNTMRTGWENVGGEWIFTNGTAPAKEGWIEYGGKWYFMENGGVAARDKWVDGGRFYVGEDGAWDGGKQEHAV